MTNKNKFTKIVIDNIKNIINEHLPDLLEESCNQFIYDMIDEEANERVNKKLDEVSKVHGIPLDLLLRGRMMLPYVKVQKSKMVSHIDVHLKPLTVGTVNFIKFKVTKLKNEIYLV